MQQRGRKDGEKLDRLREVFHRCWSNAVRSPDYDRRDWNTLSNLLLEVGVPINGEWPDEPGPESPVETTRTKIGISVQRVVLEIFPSRQKKRDMDLNPVGSFGEGNRGEVDGSNDHSTRSRDDHGTF